MKVCSTAGTKVDHWDDPLAAWTAALTVGSTVQSVAVCWAGSTAVLMVDGWAARTALFGAGPRAGSWDYPMADKTEVQVVGARAVHWVGQRAFCSVELKAESWAERWADCWGSYVAVLSDYSTA